MRSVRAVQAALLLVVLVTGCASPQKEPVAQPPVVPVTAEPAVTPKPSVPPPKAKEPPARARVTVDQSQGDQWSPVTVLNATAPPGPATVRLSFSKPVRREEVEQALITGQSVPVRGLMQWEDDQTLIWQIADLPPRLDFFLDGAHDRDGLGLPGGIPSIRVGEAPRLVELDLTTMAEKQVAVLPPDIGSAAATPDGKYVNLTVWSPGTSRWDWRMTDLHLDLATGLLKSGRVGTVPPRLPSDVTHWSVSPEGSMVAGFRASGAGDTNQADLVIMDLRGGRREVYPEFITRKLPPENGDFTSYLAWSPDGQRVAALHDADGGGADLMALHVASGSREVLARGLALRSASAHLAWSPSGRWLLAGNLLVDLESSGVAPLGGSADYARGLWEPGANALLYSQRDWEVLTLVDPAARRSQPVGTGLMVAWKSPTTLYLIRWSASGSRYQPPGSNP